MNASVQIAVILIVLILVFAGALIGGVICANMKDRKMHKAWENQEGN